MSGQNVRLIGSDDPTLLNIGTVKPTAAEIRDFAEDIIRTAEARSMMLPTPEARHAYREKYVPLSYETYSKAVGNLDRVVREMNREADDWHDRQERLRREQDRQRLDQERTRLEEEAAYLRAAKHRLADDKTGFIEEKRRFEEKYYDPYRTTIFEVERIPERQNLAARQDALTQAQRALEDKTRQLKQAEDRAKQSANQRKLASDLAPPTYNLQPVNGLQRLVEFGRRRDFTPDPAGYLAYLRALAPGYGPAIEGMTNHMRLPEEGRQMHTLVIGPPKWGKSETLKQLIHHNVKHNDAGVLVLDPLNDTAAQIAQWPDLIASGRLVYINPEFIPGMTVGLNPLDGSGFDELGRQKMAARWARLLGEITQELSANMGRILNNCVRVLLAVPGGATLYDLMLLLSAPDFKPKSRTKSGARDGLTAARPHEQRAAYLHQFALEYPEENIQLFFQNAFESEQFRLTRGSLVSRLDMLLQQPHVKNMLVGRQTFDLRAALDAKKVVVVNLAPFDEAAGAVGRLYLGMLLAMGRHRAAIPRQQRVPVHIVVDEATMLFTPMMIDILEQLRKFKIYLTLAQQVEGDNFPAAYKEPLKRCTGCKFFAPTNRSMLDLLEVRERIDDLPEIDLGHFWMKWPGLGPARTIRINSELADESHAVSEDEWNAYARQQAESGLYRPWKEGADLAMPAALPPLDLEPLPVPDEQEDVEPAEPDEAATVKTSRSRAPKASRPAATRRKKADAPPKLFSALDSEGDE